MRPVTVPLACLLVAGCTPVDNGFGESFRWDMAQQIINPDPVYDEDALVSGQRAAQAVDRYQKGTVKEPATVATTAAATGGGGGPR